MFQIKKHSRRHSHENLAYDKPARQPVQSIRLTENPCDHRPSQITIRIHPEPEQVNFPKITKRNPKTMASQRNTVDCCITERDKPGHKVHFQNQMRKFNLDVKQLGHVLGQVYKQIAHELQKNKVLSGVVTLLRLEIQSQFPMTPDVSFKKLQEKRTEQDKIEKEKQKIEKVLNQKNKIISEQKKLLEEIQNQRKIRLIYENYFYLLEKQIHKHHLIYQAELTRTATNKFLYLMTSTNDLVTNGHVLTLRKEDTQQNEKELTRNSYMCMPKRDSQVSMVETQVGSKVKNSRIVGKKKAAKKLVTIMNFIATSKAIETQELDLYEQEESTQKQQSVYQQRHTTKILPSSNEDHHSRSTNSIFVKISSRKSGRRKRLGTENMISLKFVNEAMQFYEAYFHETVYELFKIYHALGINIFAKKQIDPKLAEKQVEDYFNFDEEQLVYQSERRIEYLKRRDSKMSKLNAMLERKIESVGENISQTEMYIVEMEKQKKKEKLKVIEELDESSEAEAKSNESIYLTVSHLLGVNPQNYNSQKQIESLVDKLLIAEKQPPKNHKLDKKQSIDMLSQSQSHSSDSNPSCQNIQSRDSLLTFNTIFQKTKGPRGAYINQKVKTEGCERKFTPLIINGEPANEKNDKNAKNPNMNRTTKSIFENGPKTLNNLFDTMNACQSYQKVFEREEFEKEYSREITKKKRVMFRREARMVLGKFQETVSSVLPATTSQEN